MKLKNKWLTIVDKLTFAFQPIVNINNGKVIAYESLLRDYKKAGFISIDELFNKAYKEKTLYALDTLLREKALALLRKLYQKNDSFYMFYNIDNRILEMNDYKNGITKKLLKKMGYKNDFIGFEISEKHEFKEFDEAQSVFEHYSKQGFSIIIDDFGTGLSGLKMLYYLEPQYIKIDRFFITDILNDKKKRIFVKNIINMAHQLKIKVLAKGLETEEEFNICKEIGCDMVQGFYILRPIRDVDKLKFQYKSKIKS